MLLPMVKERGKPPNLHFQYLPVRGALSCRYGLPLRLECMPMCGRYRLSRRKELLAEYFETDWSELDWHPGYNIAPTQHVPVIRAEGDRRFTSLMRWGLIPCWATELTSIALTINARSETVASKPSFREPLQRRRCLVAADGFYEWQRAGGRKQPYCFEIDDVAPFAFAGLWDRWRD